jgi:hypothetical protein
MRTGRRDWLWGIALGFVLLTVVFIAFSLLRGSGTKTYASVDGVDCEAGEQLNYHVHSYLAILVEGQPVTVPANVGIMPDKCLFWLHTHDVSGVIHIEAPEKRDFTLGQFFAIWGQKLSSAQLLDKTVDSQHQLQITVNGASYAGDPSAIVLADLETIVVQYGPPFGEAPKSPLTGQ